jgi:hypothetical protein
MIFPLDHSFFVPPLCRFRPRGCLFVCLESSTPPLSRPIFVCSSIQYFTQTTAAAFSRRIYPSLPTHDALVEEKSGSFLDSALLSRYS